MTKTRLAKTGALAALLAATLPAGAWPHCQVPCGIYGDYMRFDMIAEHIATLEKSMRTIGGLSEETEKNHNQIVRWVNNKDRHADELSHIVTYYFMAQRVKPAGDSDAKARAAYLKKLELLHGMLVRAMQAKQTTDLGHIEALRGLLEDFREAYFGTDGEKHLKEHHGGGKP
ncbi:MAG: superoxide dismutase [Ni] [Elusimicrobiota bacterium]